MTLRTILTTASGRMVDLLNPKIEDIFFPDIAEHLAKENRYNGATRGLCYSVAEHSVRCADAAYTASFRVTEEGAAHLAAYVLCHDFHEAYLKDDTTPKKRAIAAVAEEKFGVLADSIMAAFAALTDRWDFAIHTAAGLKWPPPPAIANAIKVWDRVLLETEWRDLMCCDHYWESEPNIELLPAKIDPWPWTKARAALLRECHRLLPALQEKSNVFQLAHNKMNSEHGGASA